ncbi:TetR/AcrR family transcriptional regulator [Paenibacillus hamazuiensis]|uniref:TetR/AcrR family transcriptional regulator n=1 Tax=Paenibacillus hamazuiensis TaxID=2936508 RepID=UPI00200C552A|nr:TetR/AcrR family transcriptional regulator [Paenibacillus hamazuiensis]
MDHLFPVKDTASTKRKIFETAIDLFSRHGYSAVSVRHITKQVGIKESALYNHFKTKDDLLEAIYSVFRTELRQKGLPPVEKLDEILQQMTPEQFLIWGFETFKQSVQDPLAAKIWRILNIEQFRDQRARMIILDDIYKGTIDFLEAAFKILIQKGAIRGHDPRQLAFEYQYPLFSVMTEYLLLKHDVRDTAELEKRIEDHIRYFISGIKKQ